MIFRRNLPPAVKFFATTGESGFGYGKTKSQIGKMFAFLVLILLAGVARMLSLRARTGLTNQGQVILIVAALLTVPFLIYLVYLKNKKKTNFFKQVAKDNTGHEFALSGSKFFVSTGEFMRSTNNLQLYMGDRHFSL